jgi:DNA-directed RNA polymerase specialized sigma24 family protein
LLADTAFHRVLHLVAGRVIRDWRLPPATATGLVISAVGDPKTLADLHRCWFAEAERHGMRLARIIICRRVFDLLRGDARRAHHVSLPLDADEADGTVRIADAVGPEDPRGQIEHLQVVDRVRTALRGFADQGPIQARQARLMKRYVLDEVPCAALADELGCTRNALGVRVHKAMHALRRYIEAHHPEIEGLLGRDADVAAGDGQRSPRLDRKIERGSTSSRVTQRGSRSSGSCFARSVATPCATAAPIDRRLPSAP